jgi:hypothetical protein
MVTTFAPNIIIMRSPAPTSCDPAAADIFTPNRTAHTGGACARDGELHLGTPAYNSIAGDNYGMMVQNNAGSIVSPGYDLYGFAGNADRPSTSSIGSQEHDVKSR